MNCCVIIAAAGKSRRFGASDKLSQDLGGRAMIIRTVELFTKREEVRSILVAAPPDDLDAFRDRHGATLGFHGAKIVEGGRTDRWETIRNALKAAPDDADRIAVHDGARPGASRDLLDRLFEAAKKLPAVVPALAVTATVKRLSEKAECLEPEEDAVADSILGEAGRIAIETRRVVETIERRGLAEVQTPQIFDADLLRRAYAQDDLSGATDDAALVERLGEAVHAVEGEVCNFKITTPADLRLMRAVLGVKPPAERPVHKQF